MAEINHTTDEPTGFAAACDPLPPETARPLVGTSLRHAIFSVALFGRRVRTDRCL
jgi:hypothetical protein